MKKIRFTRAWRAYSKGQTAEISEGLAQQLVARRVAVEDTQGHLIETAAVNHHVETADATPKRRGRRAVSNPPSADAANR